jgi:hypothetical protein
MPAEERNTWVSLAVSLMVNAYFLNRILAMVADGSSTGPDALQHWARVVIWVVPVSIVATIVATILFSILQGILSGDGRVSTLKDERDRKFEFLGLGATMLLAIAGFLGAMAALALGYSGFIAFNLIYFGFALGDVLGSVLKLILYRTGG